MSKLWVLVAESSRAKIYSTTRLGAALAEVDDLAHPEARLHEQDLTMDRPGRNQGPAGISHHGEDDETSAKKQENINFAKRIGVRLEQARVKGDYDQLVLVAPPTFLGLLRDNLDKNVQKLVVKELHKSLVREPAAQLTTHLAAL